MNTIKQTNDLARIFYAMHENVVPDNYDFQNAKHPQEKLMWAMACEAQDFLLGVSIADIINEAEE